LRRKRGNKVYHLNIGQPDIKTPEVAMNAVRNFDVSDTIHSAGFESYRSNWKFYKIKLPINVEDIIITTGGSEALLLQW
jgi:aspartate aminotransferase